QNPASLWSVVTCHRFCPQRLDAAPGSEFRPVWLRQVAADQSGDRSPHSKERHNFNRSRPNYGVAAGLAFGCGFICGCGSAILIVVRIVSHVGVAFFTALSELRKVRTTRRWPTTAE